MKGSTMTTTKDREWFNPTISLSFSSIEMCRGMVSDFDLMMQRKKEEQGKKRRRKRGVDIINDSDDLIMELIQNMKESAEVLSIINAVN